MLCVYLLQWNGMVNQHAKPTAQHHEDSAYALTQPANPNSLGLQQKVTIIVQCFRSASQSHSEFNLSNLWQGQPINEMLCLHNFKGSVVMLQQLSWQKTCLYWVTFSIQWGVFLKTEKKTTAVTTTAQGCCTIKALKQHQVHMQIWNLWRKLRFL